MADAALLALEGAPSVRPFKKVPLCFQNFFSGLVSQRSPFSSLDNRYNRKYLGGRPEQLITGLNTELSNYATIIRRPGTSLFFTGGVPESQIYSFYSFHQLNGNISVMMDGASNIWTIDPVTGATLQYTKSAGAGQGFYQGVGSTLYVGDGVDQVAWTPGSAFRNWGIAVGSLQNVTGPDTAATAAQTGTGAVWTNPNNITTTASSYANVTLPITSGGYVKSVSVTSAGTGYTSATAVFTGGGGSGATGYGIVQAGHVTGCVVTSGGSGYTSSPSVTFVGTGTGGTGTGHITTTSSYTAAQSLQGTNFSLGLSNSEQLSGIQISVKIAVTVVGTGSATASYPVQLLINGTPTGNVKQLSIAPDGVFRTVLLGGPSDLWGITTNPSVLNLSTFGFQFTPSISATGGPVYQIQVNSYQVVVYGIGGPNLTLVSGTLTTTNGGYQYVYAYGNSSSGGLSNPTPSSSSTGDFSNKNVDVDLTASQDPQVDQIHLYRTKDGGSVYYELPSSPYPNTGAVLTSVANASAGSTVYTGVIIGNPVGQTFLVSGFLTSANNGTFTCTASTANTITLNNASGVAETDPGSAVLVVTDNNPDSTLNSEIFWPSVPYVLNTPPPTGLVNLTYHLGRIWGSVNNYVYYSAGPDAVLGNGNEGFPPANYFLFPSKVSRMIPYSSGLLVFTTDDVYIILGTSIATFYAMPFQTGVGLLSYNCLDIQGTTVYLYTSDRQFLSLSSSGFSELGFAIGDQLQNSFDPTISHVAAIVSGTSEKAVYISDGQSSWFRCNWNQAPEGGPAWSPKASITAGCDALYQVETSQGVHQLLMAYYTGGQAYVLYRNTNIYTDQALSGTANQVPYNSCTAAFGSLVLAQPGQIAEVDSIVIENTNVGSVPLISILADEISGTFESLPNYANDPPELSPSLTVMSNRWYLAQGADAAKLRHMQIKVDFNQDTVRNELLTVSVFGGLIHQT